jgi:hypothetical protein
VDPVPVLVFVDELLDVDVVPPAPPVSTQSPQ